MMKPNILLVSFDALRRDFISVYSPNGNEMTVFDKAARLGITFTNAITNASWTVPSHASFFTGLEPHKHRLFNWGQQIPVEIPTIFTKARTAGYHTAFLASDVVRTIVTTRQDDFELIGPNLGAISDRISINRDRPWCIFLHFLEMHAPYNMIAPRLTNPEIVDFDLKIPEFNYLRELICTNQVDIIRDAVKKNFAEASTIVSDLWDRLGENTITVLLSDHGEDWRPYHPFHCSFEVPVLRIPLVVAAPGLLPSIDHRLISHADIPDLIWRLVNQHEPEQVFYMDDWQPNSDKMGRIIVCGPDAFDNQETFFAACDKERMTIVKPSTRQRQRFYIDCLIRREIREGWQEESWIPLERALDEILDELSVKIEDTRLNAEETELLLKHLEMLGYI